LLAIAPAQAVILNFESLANNNFLEANSLPGNTYTESGFTLSDLTGISPQPFAVWGTRSPFYAGSTALINNFSGGITRLTQVGGGAFNLSSIDLTDIGGNFSTTVSFTGRRADTSTVTQSFTTDAITRTLQTFNFSDFTNLVAVDWGTSRDAQSFQFDNINVSAVGSNTTAVPEPLTILSTIFGVGSAVAMKRKLARCQDRTDD
jgi:hypothetical protein